MALRAVPEVALDLLEEGRREAAQPLLRAELEHAVRLEPRLLRRFQSPAAAAAWSRSSVAEITSKSAVSVASFHALDRASAMSAEGVVGRRLDVAGSATASPRAASARAAPSPSSAGAERRVDAASRGGEARLEVVEGRRGAVAERHGLLDLELERHAAVLHAAAVLDRHEPEEAVELAGAAHELVLA